MGEIGLLFRYCSEIEYISYSISYRRLVVNSDSSMSSCRVRGQCVVFVRVGIFLLWTGSPAAVGVGAKRSTRPLTTTTPPSPSPLSLLLLGCVSSVNAFGLVLPCYVRRTRAR